jgi:hypothetical protein
MRTSRSVNSYQLLAEYESLFHKSPHIMKVLEKIYTDILDFHLQSMKFFAGKCM